MSSSYSQVELRKLPPSHRMKLGQILDVDEAWKKLMCAIPSELNPSRPKYTTEHLRLVEKHGFKTGSTCGEILLDEWSTSGKNRPRVETLLELLIQCRLFRAADFVSQEILYGDAPQRPDSGPAAHVHINTSALLRQGQGQGRQEENSEEEGKSKWREILERLNNHDYNNGNLVPIDISMIKSVTRDFHEDFSIGKGAFGTVYKLDLGQNGGPILAVKLLNPVSSVVEDQFLTEIRVLSEYRHENLLPLVGYCTNGPQYCLIYEFIQKGSLLDAIANQNEDNPLEWRKRIVILHGVVKGLHYLHTAKDKPLIHRDIKSANILLDDNLLPKIGDFGLAKSLTSSNQTSALTSTIFGTSAYMAPEAFRGDISPKMDIFSFGVIILEILTGLAPYDETRNGNDIVTYLEEIVEEDISPLIDPKAGRVDEREANLVYLLSQKCLDDKKRRPNTAQVLKDLQTIVMLKDGI